MKDIFDDIPLNSDNRKPFEENGLSENKGFNDGRSSYISMGEYEELRLMLASARAAFAYEDEDIVPDPVIKHNLREMVAARKKGFEWPSFQIQWKKILNHPMPAYQFGLAMVVLLYFAILVGRNMSLSNGKNTIVVYKTDTVFQNGPKPAPPATYLSDSDQKNVVSPSYSGSYFADSIDYNIDDNSGPTLPYGFKNDDPGMNNYRPAHKNIVRPVDIDTFEKGGGLMEDSSIRFRNMHGLL